MSDTVVTVLRLFLFLSVYGVSRAHAQPEPPLEVKFEGPRDRYVELGSEVSLWFVVNRSPLWGLMNRVLMLRQRMEDGQLVTDTLSTTGALARAADPTYYAVMVSPGHPQLKIKFTIKEVRLIDEATFLCKGEGSSNSSVKVIIVRDNTDLHLKLGDFGSIKTSKEYPIRVHAGNHTVSCTSEGSNPATKDISVYWRGERVQEAAPVIEAMDTPLPRYRTTITAEVDIELSHSGQEVECVARSVSGKQLVTKTPVIVNTYDPAVECTSATASVGDRSVVLSCTVDEKGYQIESYAYKSRKTDVIINAGERSEDLDEVTKKDLGNFKVKVDLKLQRVKDTHFSEYYLIITQNNGYISNVAVSLTEVTGSNSKLQPCVSDLPSPSSTFAHLLTAVQTKLDGIESRLQGSLKALENRLEDKISDLKSTVNGKTGELESSMESRFGTLGGRLNSLENRIEDKLTQLNIRVVEALGQAKTARVGGGAVEDIILNRNTEDIKENLGSNQLATVINSLQSIAENLTGFGENMDRAETALDQWALASRSEDVKLTDLVSSVANLSSLTQSLASRVDAFTEAYAGGALAPVDEVFDPLGTGKKEWRLAFRGTAYNNVQVYHAYMNGTGIPVEVEKGCKQFNDSLRCVNHYRNRDALDNWARVAEVLFAIYKDNELVKKVIFNGKGSTYTNWFAADRVIHSSWVDLTTRPHNYFSLAGADHGNHFRRFFMNLDYHNSCDGFRGWFKATETRYGCPSEKQAIAIPMFKYASGDTFTVWAQATTATADAFGIFLKYE